ncbi:Competence protein ComM [Serratia plymuthica]|nr:Competence protein ComM [Serratia plymuthica]
MSLAVIYTRATMGVQAPSVTVEVHISNGLPGLTMVGLPETTVKEARDRVRSALINNGFTFPARRITVNLAPADLPKEGGRYDLPIALAILAASEQLPADQLARYEFLGELALSGALRGVSGAIPAALAAMDAGRQLILASANGKEVGLIAQSESRVAEHLLEVCAFLLGKGDLPGPPPRLPPKPGRNPPICRIFWARNRPSVRWRSPQQGGITCCWSARRVPGKPCWPAA